MTQTSLSSYEREVLSILQQLQASARANDTTSVEGGATETTLTEVRDAIGAKEDETAQTLSDYSGKYDWGIISLLRGIFNKLEYLINGYINLFVNISNPVQTYPISNSIMDFSGTIQNPNTSFVAIENPSYRWLLLQNLGKLNSQTGIYEGDIWVNIDLRYDSHLGRHVDPVASAEAGSYRLKPGDTLNFEGSVIPYGRVALLGTIADMQYTLKKA